MSTAKPIDTARFSALLRARSVNAAGRQLLVSRLSGSEQEADIAAPVNCGGYGRVRHFRFSTSPGWPANPLPIVPACKALGVNPLPAVMTAQVFQNAACGWRCWYCFVPDNLLRADPTRSAWVTPEDLVELYAAEPERPLILDLSGGSPDLVPEWVPWTKEALAAIGLDQSTYLWSDDNLSTTYLFEKLSSAQIDLIGKYPNYGRVCCFKGFDVQSFAFNTRAAEADFDKQFEIMRRLLALGLDLYGYVTLTTSVGDRIGDGVARFVDRLQTLATNLPLRVVPLEIRTFGPVNGRLDDGRRQSMLFQQEAIAAWSREIARRFDDNLRRTPIVDVPLR
jgi:uncharacterized Fe-S cluster-containing radical SAM superfamily protein